MNEVPVGPSAQAQTLLQLAAHIKKPEHIALISEVCAWVEASVNGRYEALERAYDLAGRLAFEGQRLHPLCATLVAVVSQDLCDLDHQDCLHESTAALLPNKPLEMKLGEVYARLVQYIAPLKKDDIVQQVATCTRQIHEVYQQVIEHSRQQLLQEASYYLSESDVALLDLACKVGIESHDGQFRNSGTPYITHPMAVARELATWRMDVQALCAGVLHDVLEDTVTSKNQLEQTFGSTITQMVDGLSKLDKLEYGNKEEHQAENFRKLILAMTKDIRVIIVKLSDRLHNMRTLDAKKSDSRKRIAQETLEIYAQLANRIGFNQVYRELQDLSFMHLYPSRYRTLSRALDNSRKRCRDVVGTVLRTFGERLVGANIEAQIKGREKNLFTIYQKMQRKHVRFAEVMDIYGFRVIVNSVPACYAALGVLHGVYQPKPGRVKDYIAIPKANGYQSLHTTLVGPHGYPIEVQIRTREMDVIAEGGVSGQRAKGQSGPSSFNFAQMRTNQWLQNILDLQANSDNALEFLENVKVDLFPHEVYVFTPKGKIMVLPKGATPIDFAYAVHTDIGNRTIACRINNNLMPLRTHLNTGDTVEIITSTKIRPNPSWLNFAVSARARSAIRHQIKNMDRADAMVLGESLLQKALESLLPKNILLSESLKDKYLNDLANKETDFSDVLYDVGVGKLQPVSVAMHIATLAGEHFGVPVTLSPIKISGDETGRLQLASCCNPILGDPVKALLLKGKGMVIHRDVCPNVLKSDPENQLDADWDYHHKQPFYRVILSVEAEDVQGLLLSLVYAISSNQANIESVETPSHEEDGTEGFIEFRFTVHVDGVSQLQHIKRELESLVRVRHVRRL